MLQKKPGSEGSTASGGGELAPMGSRAEVVVWLGNFNTSHDGGPPKSNAASEFLYGPGLVAELPLGQDPVNQVMVQVNDADVAWPVLSRMCKSLLWRMVDVESGQTFG